MDATTSRLMFGAAAQDGAPGQQEWTTPGTYSFVVPAGIYAMSAVLIGGGQGGGNSISAFPGTGGAGGALRYIVSFPVVPFETLTVTVGAGGLLDTNSRVGFAGGISSIKRGSTTILAAAGGGGSGSSTTGSGIGGGDGGNGGSSTGNNGRAGGGAAGYSGRGGLGDSLTQANRNGVGGGAAAGQSGLSYSAEFGYSNAAGGGPGGGVGLYGEGASGVAPSMYSTGSASPGPGGSGGTTGGIGQTNGVGGSGGLFGGGGGGAMSPVTIGGAGGGGGARMIWPAPERSYPSTRTANEFP